MEYKEKIEELVLEIDHNKELIESDSFIKNLKKEIQTINILNDKIFIELYEKIIKVLDYLGTLSSMCFNYTDQFESLYHKKYNDSKEAKTKWLECTKNIHHKYDKQKNRCFKMIDFLDGKYYEKFKKEPPNWTSIEMSPLLDYIYYIKSK